MWYHHGMTGYGWVLMSLSMLVFWALLIGALVVLVRILGRGNRAGEQSRTPKATPSAAEELLRERFARGEIDQDEFRRRLAVLRGGSAPDARG